MLRFFDQLVVSPLGDGTNWALQARFRYWSVALNRMVEVPVRFVTDFGSVPGVLKLKFPPWSRAGGGYLLHDFAYWDQTMTRPEADNLLREAMDVLGVDATDAMEIYQGVHLFGQAAWDRNAALKASGYTRLASTESNPPYASAA
jgi:hypothetical protein